MVEIEIKTTLEKFRRFVILNTCYSFIPRGYLKDPSIFPERDTNPGRIYVEALSKLNLGEIREIRFVKAYEVLGLIWRQVRGTLGKVSGTASPNSIVNLIEAGALPRSYVKQFLEEFEKKSRELKSGEA